MLAKMDDPRRESIANSKQKAIDNKIQKRTKKEEKGIQQTKEKEEEEKIGEEKRKNRKGSTDSKKEGQHCIWPTAAAAGQKLWGIFICLQIDYQFKKKRKKQCAKKKNTENNLQLFEHL